MWKHLDAWFFSIVFLFCMCIAVFSFCRALVMLVCVGYWWVAGFSHQWTRTALWISWTRTLYWTVRGGSGENTARRTANPNHHRHGTVCPRHLAGSGWPRARTCRPTNLWTRTGYWTHISIRTRTNSSSGDGGEWSTVSLCPSVCQSTDGRVYISYLLCLCHVA